MNELKRRQELVKLGQRAVDYYIDTGLCVFCNANDLQDIPHEDCDVGEVSGVIVDAARKKLKASQRMFVDTALEYNITREPELLERLDVLRKQIKAPV